LLRVVFDTNVLVSILIRKGKPRDLWNSILEEEKIKLILSEELFSEFSGVIARPHLQKYADKQAAGIFQEMLLQKGELVKIKEHLRQVTGDPDDNIIVETAVAGDAEYIVSGDKHLLDLKEFRGIQIVSVASMLPIIEHAGKRL